jgi:hypothetical protein
MELTNWRQAELRLLGRFASSVVRKDPLQKVWVYQALVLETEPLAVGFPLVLIRTAKSMQTEQQ